jgi:hypothetical protein
MSIFNYSILTSHMHISWLGGTTIKIQVKPADKDIVIVIDPIKPDHGSFPRSLNPDVGLYTHGKTNSITLSGETFTLDTAGECETKGVLISGVDGHASGEVMYRLDAEGMSIGHLGLTDKPLTNAELELLGGVDILLIPIEGDGAYDAEGAVKTINIIEPRVVIPIAFRSENNPKIGTVDAFLKEMGTGPISPEKKIILKKKDLPQEETHTIILEKE